MDKLQSKDCKPKLFGLNYKVGRSFPMVIQSKFRMELYRDDNHQENAPHFT